MAQPTPTSPDGPDLPDYEPAPDTGLTIDSLSLAAWSALATAVLVLIAVVVASVAGRKVLRVLRQQAGELTRLRQEVAALRAPEAADSTPRIGAEDRVFQVGDTVEVTEGPHRGDLGTIAESPDWLKPGYVCVELSRSRARVYMTASRLEPLQT
jgi:heme exporter protein D